MELEHSSHEHPLLLHEDGYTGDLPKQSCNGCWQPISISGSFYSCSDCQYFLHKRCAEQPWELNYPLHCHPLTLHPQPPYRSHRCYCSACYKSQWQHFTYHCPMCKFDLDIECAIRASRIKHGCHKHPLIPLQKSASFFCEACRRSDIEGPSYLCPSCQFWVHQKCADWLPSSLEYEHNHHDHPLELSYSFPHEFHRFLAFCEICSEKLNQQDWVYYCTDCRYFLHSNCCISLLMTMKKNGAPALTSNNLNQHAELKADSIIRLPPLEESTDPITLFIKGIRLTEKQGNQTIAEPTIKHASHGHRLMLIDLQQDNCDQSHGSVGTTCRRQQYSVLLHERKKNNQACAGCRSTVLSPPFYKCVESEGSKCTFLLHKWCAELPEQLKQHPCHLQHPLVLATEVFGMARCNSCKKLCLGFVFFCDNCQFYLDIGCAAVPGAIDHELHEHSRLVMREYRESDGYRCSGCSFLLCGMAFACNACEIFKLDKECALLPRAFRHRYDEHPFQLTYSPVKGIEEYFCEICELDINPRQWFYCCSSCDQSIHPECVFPIGHPAAAFNPGDILSTPHHPHHLTLEQAIDQDGVGLSCNCCGKGFSADAAGFECFQCSFRLHRECADMPQALKLKCDDHQLRLVSSFAFSYSSRCSMFETMRIWRCRLCGQEGDPKLWFYHCSLCDSSVHLKCASNYCVVVMATSSKS